MSLQNLSPKIHESELHRPFQNSIDNHGNSDIPYSNTRETSDNNIFNTMWQIILTWPRGPYLILCYLLVTINVLCRWVTTMWFYGCLLMCLMVISLLLPKTANRRLIWLSVILTTTFTFIMCSSYISAI